MLQATIRRGDQVPDQTIDGPDPTCQSMIEY